MVDPRAEPGVERMSVCALSVPVSSLSPGRRCSTFGGAGILGCVPVHSNTDEDDVVDGKMVAEAVDREAKVPAKRRERRGCGSKGKGAEKSCCLLRSSVRTWGRGGLLQTPLPC